MSDFDPVAFGAISQRVEDLSKKIDKMESQLEELVSLANKGKGGFWMGMVVVSAISSFVGFLSSHLGKS
jgi:hypothetical protein